ncbi:MAG: glycosyltransferase, partial [Candidatus Aminicenantes bacterium]|nr:glycosyltransferase [Candidatus Aminicenantes bacterium]
VHLSNALLLGLAYRLRHDLGARVVCSLQDENEWIDEMETSQQPAVWGLMGDKAEFVDSFIATSQYYSKRSQREMSIPAEKIQVINGGVNLEGYQRSALPFEPPVIGYLCRMSENFGFGIVVDAFLKLKKDSRFKDLKLFVTGGYTSLDKPFVDTKVKKIKDRGVDKDFKIFPAFDKSSRIEFLKSLTLLSVPVPSGEAFGAYQVEALAAGVPVVQPNVGCYPEFVEATKGGIIYEPNDPHTLAQAFSSLLIDPDRVRTMGEQGNKVVMERNTMAGMANSIVNIYENLLG